MNNIQYRWLAVFLLSYTLIALSAAVEYSVILKNLVVFLILIASIIYGYLFRDRKKHMSETMNSGGSLFLLTFNFILSLVLMSVAIVLLMTKPASYLSH